FDRAAESTRRGGSPGGWHGGSAEAPRRAGDWGAGTGSNPAHRVADQTAGHSPPSRLSPDSFDDEPRGSRSSAWTTDLDRFISAPAASIEQPRCRIPAPALGQVHFGRDQRACNVLLLERRSGLLV